MGKTIHATTTIIPTIDLSPFMEGGDKLCQKKVMDTIFEACTISGVFQIENHGVSLDHCEKLLEFNKTFFGYSDKVKIDSTMEDMSMGGLGYNKRIDKYHEYDFLLMHSPEIPYNGVPTIQPDYRETFEEVFKYFVKTSQILEEIINDCLGLPSNFLKNYNNDRSWDFMMPMHYAPSNENGDIGVVEHADPNLITIILQDDVCGLEVFIDEEWIPIIPTKGKLVVIVTDLIQVLSNKKATHVKHRVMRNTESYRLAIDFCYSFGAHKWVEPLHELTVEIGVNPKYRGFMYKEYIDLMTVDIKNPPANVEDYIDITYYEISRDMSYKRNKVAFFVSAVFGIIKSGCRKLSSCV